MEKPKDFDTAPCFGNYPKLPAGGYVCRIMSVEETQSKNGADMIKISLDIAEGKYKDFYAARWKEDKRMNRKWGCIVYQLVYATDGTNNTNPGFKSFTTSVTESNNGFAVQWGQGFANCFKNRLIGVLFGREEYLNRNDELHWSTKPMYFRSTETIRSGDFEVPADKPYYSAQNNGYAPPPQYNNSYSAPSPQNNQPAPNCVPNDLSDFEEVISADDLPF